VDISSPTLAIGTQIATQPRPSSPSVVISGESLSTVEDLMNAIDFSEYGPRAASMLRTTAVHLSEFAAIPLSKLPIAFLEDVSPSFALYLKGRRYAANSIRTYCQYARVLHRHAIQLGWSTERKAIIEAWAPVVKAIERFPRATMGIVRFGIRKGKGPEDLCDSDIEEWRQWMQRRGRKHSTLRRQVETFRRAIVRAELKPLFPKLSWKLHPSANTYKVRTRDLPEPLRSEVVALLQWKQNPYSPGRPQKGRHRPVSAAILEQWIGRLYGFASNIDRRDIRTLLDLVNEEVINSFVSWALNTRHLCSTSLNRLNMLYAAMRHHPLYKNLDLEWFAAIFSQLPADQESTRLERKAAKYVPYETLAEVPNRMRMLRDQRTNLDERKRARLFHDELLITWLITLPWRQRNLRECRIGAPHVSNLFFAELPPLVHIAKPSWVEEALSKDPHQQFWQFHFREVETKMGQAVRGILPRRLIPLLEAYLEDHRPHLMRDTDPGTLFLNHNGGPLRGQEISELVSQRTFEHTGRRVNPHLVRDIFAYAWLDDHPEDYLTVSKILWHRNIATTLQVYGKNFDESNGVRRIDEWLSSRPSTAKESNEVKP
jgi:integrase